MLTAAIPKVFYADLETGLDLFVGGAGMELLYRDDDLAVVGRDHAKVYLCLDADLAAGDRPELALETDDIEAEFAAVVARRPDLLHPNLPRVTRRPWGPREFALLDRTTVCLVFRDWT